MVIITLFSNMFTSSQEFQGWFSGMAQGLRVGPPKRVEVFGTPAERLDICWNTQGPATVRGSLWEALGSFERSGRFRV